MSVPKDPTGKQWGVAGDLQVVALFYNTAALEEVGQKLPTADWKLDDLNEAARRLTDPAKKQFGFYSQPNYITTSWYLFPKLFGAGVLDDTLTKAQFTHPKVQEAFQALLGYADRGHAPPFVDQAKYPFAPAPNAEGRSAMSFGIYGAMAGPAYKDHTFDVELVPSGPAGRWATVINNAWVIGRQSTAATRPGSGSSGTACSSSRCSGPPPAPACPCSARRPSRWSARPRPRPRTGAPSCAAWSSPGRWGRTPCGRSGARWPRTSCSRPSARRCPWSTPCRRRNRLAQVELDKFYKKPVAPPGVSTSARGRRRTKARMAPKSGR